MTTWIKTRYRLPLLTAVNLYVIAMAITLTDEAPPGLIPAIVAFVAIWDMAELLTWLRNNRKDSL